MHKMQLAIFPPLGEAKMGYVESCLVGDESYYVAVMHTRELFLALAECRSGYVALGACDGFFGQANGGQKPVASRIAQGRVAVGVSGHIVDDLVLGGAEERTVLLSQFTCNA